MNNNIVVKGITYNGAPNLFKLTTVDNMQIDFKYDKKITPIVNNIISINNEIYILRSDQIELIQTYSN